jgi:hypothetical protein
MPIAPPRELSEAIAGELSEPFCSYCGRTPKGAWRERPHRTCRRCGFGVMLWAPIMTAPRRDPFLVVDEALVVQAISRDAEAILAVDEPAGVSAPLDEFLLSVDDRPEPRELARLVRLAATGTPSAEKLQMRTAHDSDSQFTVRVTSCGPPLAAMVILRQVTTDAGGRRDPGAAKGSASPGADGSASAGAGAGAGLGAGAGAGARAGAGAGAGGSAGAGAGAGGAGAGGRGQGSRRVQHETRQATEPFEPDPARSDSRLAEEAVTHLASTLIVAGQRLADTRSDIDGALGAIGDLRAQLEHAELELVDLARRSGRSWAQIGADLNIIVPRQPDPDARDGLRQAHARRATDEGGERDLTPHPA